MTKEKTVPDDVPDEELSSVDLEAKIQDLGRQKDAILEEQLRLHALLDAAIERELQERQAGPTTVIQPEGIPSQESVMGGEK